MDFNDIAIFNKTSLSPLEVGGVSAVGIGFGVAGAYLAANVVPPKYHFAAMVGAGAVSYIAGVLIGNRRPAKGWLG